MRDTPEFFMRKLLHEAKQAAQNDEVPIAAAVVRDGVVLSLSSNAREQSLRITGHAEVLALEAAAQKLGRRILQDCDLVVTVEPCLMCWGTILQARVRGVYYGAPSPKFGALESLYQLGKFNYTNHRPEVVGGILAPECAKIMSEYFGQKRSSKA